MNPNKTFRTTTSVIKPMLRDVLRSLIKYLDEDEMLHFNKIHSSIDDMTKTRLIDVIQLVERTLNNNGFNVAEIITEHLRNLSLDD